MAECSFSKSDSTSCSIGILLDLECNKTSKSCPNKGLINVSDLSMEKLELLRWRTDLKKEDLVTLCLHHESVFLTHFESFQWKCCDPYNLHKKAVRTALRPISVASALELNNSGIFVKPGEKLCTYCRKQGTNEKPCDSEDEDFVPIEAQRATIDSSIGQLGCSPLKIHGVADKISYGKRKLTVIKEAIGDKVAKVLNIPTSAVLGLSENINKCDECGDFRTLIQDLKDKCSISTTREKVRLLTMAPSSWNIERVALEFNVSQYLVKKARKLYKSDGILADPVQAQGKRLPTDSINAVKHFYEDDEFSRMCPGKKDFVSVKESTGRIHKQKRLLLTNIKEMHVEFKQRTKLKIGLSKFCELRPKWCVTVDNSGMHSVCVCQIHQNLKLQISVLPERIDMKNIFLKMVCSLESRECMLHRCSNCLGRSNLCNYIESLFTVDEMEADDVVNYKQWCHNGQLKLESISSTVSEFISLVSEAADMATGHHFTCKSQAQYLRLLKESLPITSAIILLDFAENYSFVCQDATQGFHWNTEQATLHPFALYYRMASGEELTCLSICIVSDEREHLASTVYCFIKRVIQYVKEQLPIIQMIHYFSDGASAQYKNCKNLINLCHHKTDYEIEAEWNFFATSHGKSPCDGIGGTVKRLAARASLQATDTGHIMTPLQLFQWANTNIKGIKFFYLSTEEVQECSKILQSRFMSVKTVAGTRSHHRFVPVNNLGTVNMYRLSSDSFCTTVSVTTAGAPTDIDHLAIDINPIEPVTLGQYVAAVYDNQWYIGIVTEQSEEHGDVTINFMSRNSDTNILTWPSRKDECAVPPPNVLCVIKAPISTGSSGRHYKLSQDSLSFVLQKYDARVRQ